MVCAIGGARRRPGLEPPHVPPEPSIEHCKREQYSSITGAIFGDTRRGACDMLRSGRFIYFRYGWVRLPENRSEVLAAS